MPLVSSLSASSSFKIPNQRVDFLICNEFPHSFKKILRWSNSKQITAETLVVFSNTLFNKHSNVASYVISDADRGSTWPCKHVKERGHDVLRQSN
jgi:hypothetical protein